jgi:hypothetical protein
MKNQKILAVLTAAGIGSLELCLVENRKEIKCTQAVIPTGAPSSPNEHVPAEQSEQPLSVAIPAGINVSAAPRDFTILQGSDGSRLFVNGADLGLVIPYRSKSK